MSKIRITNFGSLVPKAAREALPDNAAQASLDLRSDTPEFRPMPADATAVAASGVNNPLTIHRLARKADGTFNADFSTGWIVKAGLMSFAKGQVNSDTSEQTCATFDDASAPPRMFTADDLVTGRLLGVPAPTEAPTVSVNVVDEFTVEERAAGIDSTLTYVYNEARAKCTPSWVGAAHPTADGYADRDGVVGGDPQEAQQVRLFRYTSSGTFDGTMDYTYTGVSPDFFKWVVDPSLGGYFQQQGLGWPGWATAGRDHWLLPFHAYGMKWAVDVNALGAVLATMATPGVPGSPLLTTDQVADIKTNISAFLAYQDSTAQPKVDALAAKVAELHTVLDAGVGSAAIAAWYATSPITTAISTAVANAAKAIWNAAVDVHGHTDYAPPAP